MTVLITFLASLLVFGAVIAIHEFGHFAAAKLAGIQVNEFSIGMGPALLQKTAGGTQYTLRLLPVGGYVAMEGEGSPEAEQAERERDARPPAGPGQRSGIPFPEAAVWKRAAVMAAGPFMNFVLGFAVLLGLIALRPDPIASKIIYEVEPGALCGQTGLAAGDEIIAVNGRRCFVANDIIYELVRTRDAEADFTVRRAGQVVELPGVRFDTYTDADGNARMNMGFTVYALEKTPANILRETVNSELYYGRVIYTSLLDLVRGRESVNNLSGPVGSRGRWASSRPSARRPATAWPTCWSCWSSSPSTWECSTCCPSPRWTAGGWSFWPSRRSSAGRSPSGCRNISPWRPSFCCSG